MPDVFSLFVFEVRAEAILPKLQMLGELEDDEDTMVHLEEGSDDEGELAPAELGGYAWQLRYVPCHPTNELPLCAATSH